MSRRFHRFLIIYLGLCCLCLPLTAGADVRATFQVRQDRASQQQRKGGFFRNLFRPNRGDQLKVTRRGIRRAEKRIKKHVDLPTPLVRSPELSKRFGLDVYLKLESATPVGSFKIRGALNKVLSLRRGQRSRGVVAASTGNHAQGVAWAARKSGAPATIVMPKGASPLKVEKTRKLGATVRLQGEDFGKSVAVAEQMAKKKNLTFISAYEDKRVIEGQGTIGREILKQLPDVDWIIGAMGGGGLMGGIASAGHKLKKRPQYLGVQSQNNAPMFEALRRSPGKARYQGIKSTIADGTLVTSKPSPRMVNLLRSRLDMVVKVSERSTERAVLDLMDTGHRVEGAGALPLAGLDRALSDLKRPALKGVPRPKKVVLVISGGNIDQYKLDAIRKAHNR